MKKYIVLFAKNILLQIFTFAFLLWMVYAAGTLITNFQQDVSEGDIITSSWYNSINTMLKWPHTDWGICAYVNGKIMCNNTSTSDIDDSETSSLQDCWDWYVLQWFDASGNKICREVTSLLSSSWTVVAWCALTFSSWGDWWTGLDWTCWWWADYIYSWFNKGCPVWATQRNMGISWGGVTFLCIK